MGRMFGRSKDMPASARARTALANTRFDCAEPGVEYVEIDYDPSVWTRMPHEGEDRTEWVERNLGAYAADLGLALGDQRFADAELALNSAADTLLTHTADFLALPSAQTGPAVVAYVDVLDTERALLEYGDPDAFLTMADLRPGLSPAKVEWWPVRRQKGAIRTSSDLSTNRETGRLECITRAHRTPDLGGDAANPQLYASAFYEQSGVSGQVLRLAFATLVHTTAGRVV